MTSTLLVFWQSGTITELHGRPKFLAVFFTFGNAIEVIIEVIVLYDCGLQIDVVRSEGLVLVQEDAEQGSRY